MTKSLLHRHPRKTTTPIRRGSWADHALEFPEAEPHPVVTIVHAAIVLGYIAFAAWLLAGAPGVRP